MVIALVNCAVVAAVLLFISSMFIGGTLPGPGKPCVAEPVIASVPLFVKVPALFILP